MTTREDITARLAHTAGLEHTPAVSALTAEAVTWADALGAEVLQVSSRVALTREYFLGNEQWRALDPLNWSLARFSQRPELFSSEALRTLTWDCTWAVAVAASNPAVSVEQLRVLTRKVEAFHSSQGGAMRGIYGQRSKVASLLGREDEAAEALAQWRRAEPEEDPARDVYQPLLEIDWATRNETWDLAVSTAAPILRGDVGVGPMRETVRAASLLALLASGRPAAAWNAHLHAYRAQESSPGSLRSIALHWQYLALSGKPDRALTLLRRHLGWLPTAESGEVLLAALRGAALVLREAEAAGWGNEILGADAPVQATWCPDPGIPAVVRISQARVDMEAWARRLAGLYDRRNGNRTVSEQLDRDLARPVIGDGGIVLPPADSEDPVTEPLDEDQPQSAHVSRLAGLIDPDDQRSRRENDAWTATFVSQAGQSALDAGSLRGEARAAAMSPATPAGGQASIGVKDAAGTAGSAGAAGSAGSADALSAASPQASSSAPSAVPAQMTRAVPPHQPGQESIAGPTDITPATPARGQARVPAGAPGGRSGVLMPDSVPTAPSSGDGRPPSTIAHELVEDVPTAPHQSVAASASPAAPAGPAAISPEVARPDAAAAVPASTGPVRRSIVQRVANEFSTEEITPVDGVADQAGAPSHPVAAPAAYGYVASPSPVSSKKATVPTWVRVARAAEATQAARSAQSAQSVQTAPATSEAPAPPPPPGPVPPPPPLVSPAPVPSLAAPAIMAEAADFTDLRTPSTPPDATSPEVLAVDSAGTPEVPRTSSAPVVRSAPAAVSAPAVPAPGARSAHSPAPAPPAPVASSGPSAPLTTASPALPADTLVTGPILAPAPGAGSAGSAPHAPSAPGSPEAAGARSAPSAPLVPATPPGAGTRCKPEPIMEDTSAPDLEGPYPELEIKPVMPVYGPKDAVLRYSRSLARLGADLDGFVVADRVAAGGVLEADWPGPANLQIETAFLRADAKRLLRDHQGAIRERHRMRSSIGARDGELGFLRLDILSLRDELEADTADAPEGEGLDAVRAAALAERAHHYLEALWGLVQDSLERLGAMERAGRRDSAVQGTEYRRLVQMGNTAADLAQVLSTLSDPDGADAAIALFEWILDAVPEGFHGDHPADDLDLMRARRLNEAGFPHRASGLADDVLRRHDRTPVLAAVTARTILAESTAADHATSASLEQRRQAADALAALKAPVSGPLATVSLGRALAQDGRPSEAAEAFSTALSELDSVDAPGVELYVRGLLASAQSDMGENRGAVDNATAVARILVRDGRVDKAVEQLSTAAAAAADLGDNVTAADLHRQIADLHGTGTEDGKRRRSRSLRDAARAVVDAPSRDEAVEHLDEARALMEESRELLVEAFSGKDRAWERGAWHDAYAFILARAGHDSEAVPYCEAAVEGFMAKDDRRAAAESLTRMVRSLIALDERTDARAACDRIRELLADPAWEGDDALAFVDEVAPTLAQ
ncbi:hypothetical protein CHIBA101_0123 [Actinomyces sp. Chiba101]|uniref:hypothetical protein n=1 Tax=Actinomyces TaxID=1654 RepID=UPI000974E321|nr:MULTISPECIES: hypothetical protein [Actinomyces]BAW91998.1 hypothetical protein CHIBA101_0123 [Actinomyces sp. Chiba101]SUU12078.1 Uncharacterised protein [Actinomyces denticolens]